MLSPASGPRCQRRPGASAAASSASSPWVKDGKPLPGAGKNGRRSHPALPWQEIPQFMSELRQRDSISARALEFTILTAARTGETIGAKWDELDLDAKIWTVPAERMKGGREHRVPLSMPALELLRGLPREDDAGFVFAGAKNNGAGLSATWRCSSLCVA